ncbi:MAG: rhamnosidase [Verrucomicrobia bacterium]|nr:MAG: rhamnosidase [Verrucomicrobiota bacterium]
MKITLGLVLLSAVLATGASALEVGRLRCEYRVDPLGIDVTQPRLSWMLQSDERGERQTAYHVLVASSEKSLKKNVGDLWDSGVVKSDDTISVVYQGKALPSGQSCFWKVKVWDRDGKDSGWSKPALWTMGLLKPEDWKAEWIGFDKPREVEPADAPVTGAQWIWYADDPQPNPPVGHRVFLKTMALPATKEIETAELLVTGDDTFSVNLNGAHVAVRDAKTKGPRVVVRRNVRLYLKDGQNEIRATVDKATPSPAGFLAQLIVKTKTGQTITVVSDSSWLASKKMSAEAADHQAWSPCRVLGAYGMAPWGQLKVTDVVTPPAVYLRTAFSTAQAVVRATLYATALGWFDLHLNGQRVNASCFDPGWTDYAKRLYYRTYDVTPLVRRGANALGAVLSDGWFSGYIGWGGVRDHYGERPRVLMQLVLEYADGSRESVVSGPQWKASTGPILGADILMGETYDARKELIGWDRTGFNDQPWSAVSIGAELKPVIEAHPGPAVMAIQEFRAQKITAPQPGVYVLDLGQNFAGVVRLKVRGAPGQKITLRHGERLNPDGTLYTINLRSAQATDTYICKGAGTEVWSPRFTFHGFQYVEVTGLTKPPTPDTIVGLALSSATPVVGSFTCSDELLNKLHSNIYWTQRMNFIDIPTDCPQRDERLGWTGDAQVYIRTATLNCDAQAFYTKWLVDLCEDSQRADGQFPMIAPLKVSGPDGGPAWADAGVICPWTVYAVYGDTRILEQHYAAMARFIDFCKNRCTPELLPPKQYHCFGDWLNIKADTPKDVIFMAYFANCTRLMAQVAAALGKVADVPKYNVLFEQLKAAFNKAYVASDGRIKGDTQADYVLALVNDLVEGEQAQRAAKYLVENIEARGNHLSTGFVGTKDLMLALAKIGRNDVAYRLIHNDTFPSWGFSIKHGATTIWERWNGWTPEEGFGNPGMNSFAHYSFGAVYQWMVENIGGIRAALPAYKHIIIAPQPGGKLTSAATSYDSVRGRIATAWQLNDGKLTLAVTIPPNTTATVFMPAKSAEQVNENGKALAKARGVKFLGLEKDCAVLAVESGNYRFQN